MVKYEIVFLLVFTISQLAYSSFPSRFERYYIPPSIDWRNYTTAVQTQGRCYFSGWAFATVGAIEAKVAIKNKKAPVRLSVQQLLDCSTQDFGCRNGSLIGPYNYLKKAGGLMLDSVYPYRERKENECLFTNTSIGAVVKSFSIVRTEKELEMAVALYGPVAVNFTVADSLFEYDTNTIYDDGKCEGDLSHLLVVGFENRQNPYWIVKTPFSPYFGEKGYVKIKKDAKICGIGSFGVYPII